MTREDTKTKKSRRVKRAGLLLAIPMTLGLAGIASAHPEGKGMRAKGPSTPAEAAKMKKCHEQFRAVKIKKFDTDGDGKLSPEERQIGKATHKAERLGQFDKDKDGVLSKAERADMLHEKVTERFERIDTNGDAEISSAEANESCSPLGRHFERVDSDGNDSISWTEFEKVASKRMKRMKRGKRGKRGMRGGKFRKHHGPAGGGDAS